jgi:hypothetical protein
MMTSRQTAALLLLATFTGGCEGFVKVNGKPLSSAATRTTSATQPSPAASGNKPSRVASATEPSPAPAAPAPRDKARGKKEEQASIWKEDVWLINRMGGDSVVNSDRPDDIVKLFAKADPKLLVHTKATTTGGAYYPSGAYSDGSTDFWDFGTYKDDDLPHEPWCYAVSNHHSVLAWKPYSGKAAVSSNPNGEIQPILANTPGFIINKAPQGSSHQC